MTWAQDQRQHFITARLLEVGKVNRADLMREFRISVAQASVDFRTYRERGAFPVVYDQTAKAYRLPVVDR